MILKTLRLKKQNSFGRLVRYVLTDEKNQMRGETFMLTHNILGRTAKDITQEFIDNDNFRTNKRGNSVLLYHEILSFAPEDRMALTEEKLKDIAEKYIEIRCPKALVLALPHYEKDHVHLHFVVSGSEYHSQKLLRMDNKTFKQVRYSIEEYQLKTYPELSHSVAYTNKKERKKQNQREQDQNVRKERAYHSKKRKAKKGQKMDKERLSIAIRQMFELSQTAQDFVKLINKQDQLEHYTRNGRLAGVLYGSEGGKKRKYRFTTLGIDRAELLQLQFEGREKPSPKIEQKTPKKKKAKPTVNRVKTDEELKREGEQKAFIEQCQKDLEVVLNLPEGKKQDKKLGFLVGRILNNSWSMGQFMFYLSRSGIKPFVEEGKLIGVRLNGEVFTLEQMKLVKEARIKQQEFEKRKSKKLDQEMKQDQDKFKRGLEEDLYTHGFGFFF